MGKVTISIVLSLKYPDRIVLPLGEIIGIPPSEVLQNLLPTVSQSANHFHYLRLAGT